MKARRIALIACLSMTLLAGHATAGRLFGVPDDGSNRIVELDPLTGATINSFAAPVLNVLPEHVGLAFDGTSVFFAQQDLSKFPTTATLYELDPDTGGIIDQDDILGITGLVDGVGAVPGAVLIQDYWGREVYVFDPVADVVVGTLNLQTSSPGFLPAGGIGFGSNPDEGLLLEDSGGGVHTVDFTGATTFFTTMFSDAYGVAVGGDEVFVSTGTRNYLPPFGGPDLNGIIFVYDRTGTWVRTMTTDYGFLGLGSWEQPPEVIPEPTTLALLGLGLAAVARRRRRK